VADNLLGTNLKSKALTCRILLLTGCCVVSRDTELQNAAKMFEKVAHQVKLAVELSCSVTDCLRTLTLYATGSFPGLLETCKDAVVRQTNLHVAARFLHKSQCRGIHKTYRRDGSKVNCNKKQPWPKSETEKLSENIHHSMQNCFEGNPDLTDAYNKSDEFPYIPMNWSYLPPNNMVFL